MIGLYPVWIQLDKGTGLSMALAALFLSLPILGLTSPDGATGHEALGPEAAPRYSTPGHYDDPGAPGGQSPCPAGTYQPLPNQTSCLDADPGHFVASSGQANQTACPPGTYQPNSGSVSCLDADAGHFVADTSHYTDIDHTATLAAGSHHTCVILDDGSVACWGSNGYGMIGDGTITSRSTPTQTASLGTGRTAV